MLHNEKSQDRSLKTWGEASEILLAFSSAQISYTHSSREKGVVWIFGKQKSSQCFINQNDHVTTQVSISGKCKVFFLIQPTWKLLKNNVSDFPGGSLVKSLPPNAGDMCLNPSSGRSHMAQDNKAYLMQPLKPSGRSYWNPHTIALMFDNKRIHCNKEPVQFSSVIQLCLTLCDPMDCSTPGLPVHHQLAEFTQTHVHWVGDAIQPSHPLLSPSPTTFNLSKHQGLFQ